MAAGQAGVGAAVAGLHADAVAVALARRRAGPALRGRAAAVGEGVCGRLAALAFPVAEHRPAARAAHRARVGAAVAEVAAGRVAEAAPGRRAGAARRERAAAAVLRAVGRRLTGLAVAVAA